MPTPPTACAIVPMESDKPDDEDPPKDMIDMDETNGNVTAVPLNQPVADQAAFPAGSAAFKEPPAAGVVER